MIAVFSITSLLLILLAGVGAGFVGYAVGASSLVSYPALLVFGIPPVLANASNTVGVWWALASVALWVPAASSKASRSARLLT